MLNDYHKYRSDEVVVSLDATVLSTTMQSITRTRVPRITPARLVKLFITFGLVCLIVSGTLISVNSLPVSRHKESSSKSIDKRSNTNLKFESKLDELKADNHVPDNSAKQAAIAHQEKVVHRPLEKDKIQLSPDVLQPPDHLDAVKMEQDGHLNRDYRKEIFLGNHEDIELGSEQEIQKTLQDIFYRVDTNHDTLVSLVELEDWIIEKVQEHFDETHEENEKIFHALDPDKDGYITWHEFFVQFLVAKGHTEDDSEKHAIDYDTIAMDEKEKDLLVRNKFRWSEADEEPQDNKLTLEEFKNFRHPEQSKSMLNHMVNDILGNLDRDRDGTLSEDEFIVLPPGEIDGHSDWLQQEHLWQEERRKEFRNIIDVDHNGYVTKEELESYVDPKNSNHSKMEAKNLMDLGDTNKDGQLSLAEVMENQELFLGSKMVNAGKNFHDEF